MSDLPRDMTPMEEKIHAALSQIIAEEEPSMVTKWVCLVEAVTGDTGGKILWTMTSDQVSAWDTTGMLKHGLLIQEAQILAAMIADGEE